MIGFSINLMYDKIVLSKIHMSVVIDGEPADSDVLPGNCDGTAPFCVI